MTITVLAPTAGSGPTHPPGHPGTGHPPPPPPPTRGHLPIGADPAYPLPLLGQVVRDAEHLGAQMLAVLQRQWDPTSGPQQDGGILPSEVDYAFAAARTELRIALLHIGDVAAMTLPAAGSAVPVRYPGRPMPPTATGECRSPGYDAALGPAASESDEAAVVAAPSQATSFPTPAGVIR